MWYFLMALGIGMGIAVQVAINSSLAIGLGSRPLAAAFFSFAIGTLCLGLVMMWQGDWQSVLDNITDQPWWRWVGGGDRCGICVYYGIFGAEDWACEHGLSNHLRAADCRHGD